MSGNKEALIRYRAINRCLRNRKIATKEQLTDACSEAVGSEVSWRTIAQDIHAMRYDEGLKFYAPIINIKKQGYQYEEPNYSIDQIPLSDRDLDALSFAAKLLKQYSSVEIFNQFSDAVDRLNEQVDLSRSGTETEKDIIGFEHNTGETGSEFLNDLIELVKTKTVARVTYKSFTRSEERIYLIHPYYLKQYRNRWYLVGKHHDSETIRTYGLDRMIAVEPEYQIPFSPSEFDPEKYYQNAIGVSVLNQEPENIILRISSKQAPYILTLPIHSSQSVLEEHDDHIIISLCVIRNYELISSILAMGSEVSVLEPKSLAEEIRNEHKKSLDS